MDYPDYAADTSPHFSSPSTTTTTTAENNTFSHRLRPMNTFSSSPSTSLQSPPSNDVTFQQQQRSSTSSLDAERHFQLLAASSSIDTTSFHHHHHEPACSTTEFPRHVHLTPHPTTALMQEYWHGQTPLLLDNPLHVHELDNVEVNHSERGIAGFVSKLYQSLQAPDNEQKYARWCKHDGKDMFIIECIPKFTEVVLPRLFKHCKFASFVRQLNIYGFQRDTDARKTKDTRDKESCRWYHPYFRPGRRDLFHLIRRKAARYPRRKRVKVEEDPETIVNVGDDSDTEMMNDKYRCRSSSVSSTAISQAQQDSNSNNTMEDMGGNMTTTTAAAAQTTSSSPSSVMGQQQTATAQLPPPPTPSQQQQQQQSSLGHHQQQSTMAPSSIAPHTTTNSSSVVMAGSASQLQEQSPTTTTATTGGAVTVMATSVTPPTCMIPTTNDMTHRERDMQNQIIKITRGYQQLAAQIKHAYDIIEVQGRRIQALETELVRNQQRSSDMSYLGHGNNNSNGGGDHGTSTTADASNTFTNHSSPNGNTTDLYTQLFPHPGVRIKPELSTPYDNMLLPPSDEWVYHAEQFSSPSSATPDRSNAATIAAAAAAVAAAAANNNAAAPAPPTQDHTTTPTHGDMTTFGLAAAVAAAKYPPTTTTTHHQQHHHHHPHHPEQQAQQQQHHPHHSHHHPIQQHRPM